MDLEDFRTELYNRVAIRAEVDGNFMHSSFVDVAIEILAEAGEVADFEPCYYRGISSKRNIGVDGYAFDRADGSVRVFIADAQFETERKLNRDDANVMLGRLRAFVEDSFSGKIGSVVDDNAPAMALADELVSLQPNIQRIRAYVLTDAELRMRVKDWPEEAVAGVPIEFHIWDIGRFFRAYTSRTGQDELVVNFTPLSDNGIPCIEASTQGSPYVGYLCVIPGSVLATIYDVYGSRLLEGNVRSFLNTKGKINKGIRNTILHEPEMFFAYNNGIAATASSVDIRRTENGLALYAATDLQIVNGGQTTASLAASTKGAQDNVGRAFVPMKLSVIEPEKSAEMIPWISRFANSQNKVSEADFFSNHQFHRRLEEMSRRIWAPARAGAQHETHWFYERARGQYANEVSLGKESKRKTFVQENPRTQLITKTDLAKSELSWKGLPHRVSRGAQSAFMDFANDVTSRWDADEASFHEEYYRQAIARLILFRATENIVWKQPWYSGGYRANIVTYTIAKLARDISCLSRGLLDFAAIWRSQSISGALEEQISVVAKSVYEELVSPHAGYQNVTQWCKREECWLRVQQLEVAILPPFEAELASDGERMKNDRAARGLQQVDSGINAQATVVSLGTEYWNEALLWGKVHGGLSPMDERMLKAAAGHYGSLATDKQSRRLLILKRQLEDEGFRPVRV